MDREKLVSGLKESFKMQMLQFDYLRHVKGRVVRYHLAYIVGCLLLNVWLPHAGLCSLAGLVSWNYFFLFDRKRRVYSDAYRPQRWEYVGTLCATVIFASLIFQFCTCSPGEIYIRPF